MPEKKNYKDTIFLPKTTFPMKGNLPELEKRILEYWDQIDIYGLIKKKKTSKRFLFHMGPPYTNNEFHLGHALTITLKDIIARYFTMMNYEVPILQGHDCHGYSIEMEVIKLIEKENMHSYTPQKIRQLCRAYSQKWSAIHKEQTKSLGVLTNINPTIKTEDKDENTTNEEFYSTMDTNVEVQTYKLFSDLILNGHVYRGMRPVMWSINEQSTLAEVDVAYKNKKSTSVYIKLKIQQTPESKLENSYVIFWTTTPWTIISNLAVAFNQNFEYIAININGEKCYVAKNLEIDLIKKWDCLLTVEETDDIVLGSLFENSYVEHPMIEDKIVPLIHSNHVLDTNGSGFVHISPDHGEDDFELGKKHNLGLCEYVDGDGHYKDNLPIEILANKHIFKDENLILDILLPKMLSKEIIEHSYPFSDRSNSPLIYRCTEQIFINLTDTKQNLLNAISTVKWYPVKGENRITAFVKNREDWCVSRQRIWGNPLLVFVHKETNDILKDEQTQRTILKEMEKNGTDHLFDLDWTIFLREELQEHYRPVYGILDVWFDSGSTWETVMNTRYGSPVSDLYLEGSDQHRGWFQSSLALSVLKNNQSPYKTVVTHGYVVDEEGHKFSKSKKNGIPLAECRKDGMDVIRTWVSTCDYYEDIKIGKVIFQSNIETYRKIRNILRYLIGAIEGITDEEINYQLESTDVLEMYVLHKAYILQNFVEASMKEYKIKDTFDAVFKFMQDLSIFYLDIKKDILYCESSTSSKRKATRKVQYLLLELLLRLLAPFIPFTIEEVALELGRTSYHLKDIFLFKNTWGNEEIFDYIVTLRQHIIDIKIAIENARALKTINSNNEAIVMMPLMQISNCVNINQIELLEEILMVSKIIENDKNIKIYKTDEVKCDRCWRHKPHNKTINLSDNSCHLCERCYKVI